MCVYESVCLCVSFRALSRRERLFSNIYVQYKYVDLLYVLYHSDNNKCRSEYDLQVCTYT